MSLLSAIIRVTVLCALLRLAVFDVRWRRLPTTATLLIAALFFIDALVIRLPIHDVLAHLLLALAVLVICAALFAAKMLGGGDAKLACAVFLWTGPSLALPALAIVSVIGLGVSLVSLATRHMAAEQRFPPLRALAMFSGTRGVPYGVALALGGGSVIALPLLAMR